MDMHAVTCRLTAEYRISSIPTLDLWVRTFTFSRLPLPYLQITHRWASHLIRKAL